MQCRDNKFQKVITRNSRERRASRKQTFSATKGSAGRFGAHKSTVDPDDTRGLVAMYAASRNMRKAKITLAPMPWDNEGEN
jgi:hypothetical protein